MTPLYDDAPELAPGSTAPEVYHPEPKPLDSKYSDQNYHAHGGYNSTYNSTPVTSPYTDHAQHLGSQQPLPEPEEQKKGMGFGGSILIPVIVAFLAIAVIGLAAGTGVAVHKYQNANNQLSDLNQQLDASKQQLEALNATTGYNYLSNGCSNQELNTTGTPYTTQNPANRTSFTVRCNANLVAGPFFSLFATNFNSCMEACSIWNSNYNNGHTCKSVNYVPAWTNITLSWVGNSAPGNCYLKDGVIFDGTKPGVETHSGLMSD